MKNGMTFGYTKEDTCRIEYHDEGLRPSVPVIRLVPDHLVPVRKSAQGG